MAITILEDFKSFVLQSLASGRFGTKEDAVTEAFNVRRQRKEKLDSLRADLQRQMDQSDAEQNTTLHAD